VTRHTRSAEYLLKQNDNAEQVGCSELRTCLHPAGIASTGQLMQMKFGTRQIGLAVCGLIAVLLVCYVWFHNHHATVPIHVSVRGVATVSTRDREVVGIGIAIRFDQQTHTFRIVNVIPNTPASQAGLTAGLIVYRIDDVPTGGKSLAECVSLIRGTVGTKVRLALIDPERRETNTVEFTRQTIQL
jgi:PDZ domain